MNGVQQTFKDEVDYFIVDVDKPGSRDVMDQLGVRNRSTYILLDAQGNELLRLVGPLRSQSDVEASITTALAEAKN